MATTGFWTIKGRLKDAIDYPSYPMEGFCFTRDNGKVLNPQAPTSYLARFGKKYGVESLHPHAPKSDAQKQA